MSTTVYTYNDKVLKNAANDKWLKKQEGDPYNPLGLPPMTFRFQLVSGQSWAGAMPATIVSEGIVDVTFTQSNITQYDKSAIAKILGANASGFTSLNSMFASATNLTEVALFDTSNCTDLSYLFAGIQVLEELPDFPTNNCENFQFFASTSSGLKKVPNLDVSSATNVTNMFYSCTSVESGALNMYQKLSALSPLPTYNGYTFDKCGSSTVTGAAELAQIPSSWGGTAS